MRQVGVQVQDIGTFLCWQTYVDDPGRELGLGQAHSHRQAARARRHLRIPKKSRCCNRSRKSGS